MSFSIEFADETQQYEARIKVVGVGGSGGNAVNTMINFGLEGVEFIVVNTDAQALNASAAPTKLPIGSTVTRGLGASAGPERGRKAALEDVQRIKGSSRAPTWCSSPRAWAAGRGPAPPRSSRESPTKRARFTVGVVTDPLRLRRPSARPPRRDRSGDALRARRYPHHHPQPEAPAPGRRRPDLHRRVPQGRRGPLPGRQGHQRPHHPERHRQRRLRRREDGHEQHGPRPHGHRRRQGPEPGAPRSRDGGRFAAPRRHQRRGRHGKSSSTSSAAPT